MTIEEKILNNFHAKYEVCTGNPTDNGVPAKHLIYNTVKSKEGKPTHDDDEFVASFLAEIDEEYSSELFMKIIHIRLEFIEILCGKKPLIRFT